MILPLGGDRSEEQKTKLEGRITLCCAPTVSPVADPVFPFQGSGWQQSMLAGIALARRDPQVRPVLLFVPLFACKRPRFPCRENTRSTICKRIHLFPSARTSDEEVKLTPPTTCALIPACLLWNSKGPAYRLWVCLSRLDLCNCLHIQPSPVRHLVQASVASLPAQ